MDKTAIKNFAIAARRNLIKAVRQKAYDIGIFEDTTALVTEVQGGYIYNCVSYDRTQSEQRKRLIAAIENHKDDKGYAHGYNQVMEEAAYTWFNRLIALRFMELNGYLPSNIRVLSSEIEGRLEPDCIREAEHLDFVDTRIVNELKDNADKLYRYILIAQCNALSGILPKMFQKIADYTELLLPDRLYSKAGYIVYDLVHGITEKDFTEQVEIIGWLYQYYISEKKDEVFAGLKKNIKITKENIPAATQLFTPDWIVKYMVENSLGRVVVEKLKLDPKALGWKYYLEEAEQTDEVKEQLRILSANDDEFDIKSVKLIDPCMGSGHILVYAFDVFHQIYASLGYAAREIPNLILTNNLYGLDIDGRAGQLAYFALMMKARSYDRRFFRQDNIPQPKVYAISESDGIKAAEFSSLPHDIKADVDYLISLFADAKEYGSILKIDRDIDYDKLTGDVKAYKLPEQLTLDSICFEERKTLLLTIIEIARLLTQKYDVVVTNPPYLGNKGMGSMLVEYLSKNYLDEKGDTSTAFMSKTIDMCKSSGIMAMINIPVWMSKSTYERLRHKILSGNTFCNMLHFGRGIFGSDFGTVAFTIYKKRIENYRGTYFQLFDELGAVDNILTKQKWFFEGKNKFSVSQDHFLSISSYPIAYWVSEKFLQILEECKPLSFYADARKGLTTGDNDTFVRLWHEVLCNRFSIFCDNTKWVPMTKGGDFRRWYGNNEYIVNWKNDGYEIINFKDDHGKLRSRPQNVKYYFRECISWNDTTATGKIAFRHQSSAYIPNASGPCVYFRDNKLMYYFGLLNSCVSQSLLFVLAPNMKFEVGQMALVPIIINENTEVDSIVSSCIQIAKTDWDSFETSWDFKTHPLIGFKGNYEESEPLLVEDDLIEETVVTEWSKVSAPIAQSFDAWERFTDEQFTTLKANEEELNRIFIEIYGLQDELTPEVADKDVTIRRADLARDVKSFISYAVGCMFGRYSLDEDGLVFAGGAFDIGRYKTFIPETENIISITTEDYFDNDIVTRFIEFVKTVYGTQTLEENLQFIANALYPNADGTERVKIRRYFVNDFYKDHVKTYQKRPIYWLFDSNGCSNAGKQDAFKALIYLHRYDKYMAARVRVDYLHRLQAIYNGEINRCNTLIEMTTDAREIAAYKKQIETLQNKLTECRAYDPAIAHLAHKAIDLDLDDGVKVNYAKFQGVEVELGGSKGTAKVDLLGKI